MQRFRLPLIAIALANPLASQSPAEQRLLKDVTFLASPALKGRGDGYPELDRAADYLIDAYKRLGLKAEVQRFPFVYRVERQEAAACFGGGTPLVWGRDVEAYGLSADAHLERSALVFAGYGLAGHGYDDLAGLDLHGKVALIARQVPETPAFASLGRMDRSILLRLQRLETAGVAAVVVLEEGSAPRPLTRDEGPARLRIPVLSMPVKTLDSVCADLGASLQKIKDTGQPASREFPEARLDLSLKLKPLEAQLPNLAVVLKGRDPKVRSEFIVVGAHMDHLGLGERNSLAGEAGRGLVHPGADDNASGTAELLELARTFKKHRPRRSILFLHFSGEEEGLLGSAYWIQHPTVPLPQVRFMVNLDMVGRMDPQKPLILLGGLGAPKTALEKAKADVPEGVSVGGDLGTAVGGSDHMSFAAAKIPTFFFFTGVHSDYHRPTDTADKINGKGMEQVATMTFRVVTDLADEEQVPAFDPETAKLPARGGGPLKVRFGILPDYAENPKGLRISGASPGSPAQAVGLQAGDVITSIAGKPVHNIYDYMEALGTVNPGEKVRLTWLRGDQAMEGETVVHGR